MLSSLGLRHAAINVRDPQKSKAFYMQIMKMELEWEPDPQNVYLTTGGQDNLAIHAREDSAGEPSGAQLLDHLGIAVPSLDEVDRWFEWVKSQGVKILREIKLIAMVRDHFIWPTRTG